MKFPKFTSKYIYEYNATVDGSITKILDDQFLVNHLSSDHARPAHSGLNLCNIQYLQNQSSSVSSPQNKLRIFSSLDARMYSH